jgi:transcriptional regulator with XRE-family HTH domain
MANKARSTEKSPKVPLAGALGAVVRDLRRSAGHTQDSFAIIADIHRAYIGAIERGEISVSLSTLDALANGFGVRPSELLAKAEAMLDSKGRRGKRP